MANQILMIKDVAHIWCQNILCHALSTFVNWQIFTSTLDLHFGATFDWINPKKYLLLDIPQFTTVMHRPHNRLFFGSMFLTE